MFSEVAGSSRRANTVVVASVAAHCALLLFLLRSPQPVFVRPSSVAWGQNGISVAPIYLAQAGPEDLRPAAAEPKRALSMPAGRKNPAPVANVQAPQEVRQGPNDSAVRVARAGSPYGSLMTGPVTGQEVKPAIPIRFADPTVSRAELPPGVEGNIIVEITIDEVGNVIATRVLQSLGYGLEDKVLAAVRQWRFRPATRDGVPIPSQQDVYFHFPS